MHIVRILQQEVDMILYHFLCRWLNCLRVLLNYCIMKSCLCLWYVLEAATYNLFNFLVNLLGSLELSATYWGSNCNNEQHCVVLLFIFIFVIFFVFSQLSTQVAALCMSISRVILGYQFTFIIICNLYYLWLWCDSLSDN